MIRDPDVLVVGGGAAGACAAMAAAHAGARVLLLRPGPGATALALGGCHGALPAPVAAALADAGLPLHHAPLRLPRPDGTIVDCDAAPVAHARADLAADHRRTLVCGVAGLPGFVAPALAQLWADAAALPTDAIDAVTLDLDATPPAGWSPVSLAALLDREPAALAGPAARAARDRGADRVILPAVLGLDRHAAVLADIAAQIGATVGEALGMAPSVPGWRLAVALRAAVQAYGVAVLAGRARSARIEAGRVHHVTVEAAGGVTEITASVVVLATGRFIGGGITAAPRLAEAVFGCDVAIDLAGRRFDDATESLRLTSRARGGPQPLLGVGVRADADGRPLTAAGGVALDNVVVAGSVRAAMETAALGIGAAATDGWNAGTRAALLAVGPAGGGTWR